MAGGRKFNVPRPQGLALWVPISLLLVVGLLTTVVDLFHLPLQQTTLANAQRQRFVINPLTGDVSLGSDAVAHAKSQKGPEFDVAATAGDAHASTDQEIPVTVPVDTTAPATEPAANTTPKPTDAAEEVPLPSGAPALRTEPYTADMNAPVHSKESLVSAPAPEVTEAVDGLKLPKRGDKDVLPSQLYARPFKRTGKQVLLSFVVLDAGLDPQSVGLVMGLPPEVSVAYSPYTRSSNSYSENLRAAGHEVWTMLPTMGERYPSDDPGPLGLIARMPVEEIIRRLREVLAATPGIVGVVLPPDETISTQKGSLAPVFGELDKRGLLALSTHPSHSIEQLTSDKALAAMIRRADLVLDPAPNEAQIKSKLAGLVDSAKEKGEYLVVLSGRPQSLQLLIGWIHDTKLPEPLVLAPLSAMYQPKEAPEVKEEAAPEKPKEKKKEEKPKKPKVLPQDQYKQPPAGAEGEKKPEGGHH